jgi:hypothetical protein
VEAGKGVLTGAELGTVAALGVKVDKWLEEEEVPRAWFSSYTRMARACGTRRRSAPMTRRKGNGSHRRQAVGGHVMRQGGQRKRTPVMRPGAKEAQGHRGELGVRNRLMAARHDS